MMSPRPPVPSPVQEKNILSWIGVIEKHREECRGYILQAKSKPAPTISGDWRNDVMEWFTANRRLTVWSVAFLLLVAVVLATVLRQIKIFDGAKLIAGIVIAVLLVDWFLWESKILEAKPGPLTAAAQGAYTRGARFDLPELCPDSNLYRRLEQGEKVDWGLGNRPGCDVQTFNIQSGEAEVGLVYASGKIDQIVWRGTGPGFQFKERVVGVSMKANTPVVYRAY